jgi:type IV fimbrial biogenesis protein FimT
MAGKQPLRLQGGFSLVELVITIAVIAVLLAIGLPSFKSTMRSNRVASQGNSLQAAINLARSEAIRTNLPAGVCPTASPNSGATAACGGTFNTGWIAFDFTDATQTTIKVVRVFLPDSNVTWTPNSALVTPIVFNNQGMATSTLTAAPTTTPALVLQPNDCPHAQPYIIRNFYLNSTGQLRMSTGPCP